MDIDVSKQSRSRRASFFAGALLGISLIALAASIGVGPGAALLSLLGAFVLIVSAPVLQFFLLKTETYKGRLWQPASLSCSPRSVSSSSLP